ncbi:MAG: prepilin-type N-terminal cleavage/methylation domain-containing protein [Myxococcota bacterium]
MSARAQTPKPSPCSDRAFTLIELLVVISIIALLIGILLPVLGRARDSARTLQCQVNHRTMGVATANYLNDADGFFPMPDTGLRNVNRFGQLVPFSNQENQRANWFVSLDYYLSLQRNQGATVGDIRNFREYKQDPVWLTFPDQKEDPNDSQTVREFNRTIKMNRAFRRGDGPGGDPAENQFAFGENGKKVDTVGGQYVSDRSIRNTSDTVLFGDGLARDIARDNQGDPVNNGRFSIEADQRVALRHANDTATIGFTDGSVRLIKQPSKLTNTETSPDAETAGSTAPTLQWFPEFQALGDPTKAGTRNEEQELIWDMIRDQ